jgi:hypothetical protein
MARPSKRNLKCIVCRELLPDGRWRFCSDACRRRLYEGSLINMCKCGKSTAIGEPLCANCKQSARAALGLREAA